MATAVQVESIWNGLTDNSGQPLAAGKVYTYAAGTTSPVSLYTASDKTSSATNPLILDGNGKAQVWADGRYKFVVKSSADVTLYTLDNLLYGFDDTTVLLGGISTGSANAQVVSVPATVESYANGQRITFIAGYTNSGATTLQFNALAPISIVKGPLSSSLQNGDLIAGQLYSCTYYGGSFRLENVPTPADVQRSRAQVISSVAGTNTITGTLSPALTGYEAGSVFRFKAANSNIAGSGVALNIDGQGAKTIQYNNAALVGGEIAANIWHEVVYDGTQFQLLNPVNVSAPLWGGTTAGTSTAYTITPAPAITAYATGQRFTFKAHVANGATPTIAVSGLTAKTMQRQGLALVGAEFIANDIVSVVYDGTNFQILNVAQAPLYVDRTNNRVGIAEPSTGAQLHVMRQVSANQTAALLTLAHTNAVDNVTNRLAFNNYNGIASAIDSIQNAGTNFQSQLVFSTQTGSGMTEKMRIDAAGRVGIGTTSPTSALTVSGPISTTSSTAGVHLGITGAISGIELTNSGGGYIDFTNTTTDSLARIIFVPSSSNNFQIHGPAAINFYTSGFERGGIDVSGYWYLGQSGNRINPVGANVYIDSATGGIYKATSSLKYKKDVRNYSKGLAEVLALRPVSFKSKDSSPYGDDFEFAGLIAEEVHAAGMTEFVQYAADSTPDGLSYGHMVALAFKAIQELNAKVEALEARVAALEA